MPKCNGGSWLLHIADIVSVLRAISSHAGNLLQFGIPGLKPGES